MINYYTTLGVNENASDEEISQAYRNLVRINRKDTEKIKTINTAYNVLKKSEKRRDYDAELARERSNSHSHSVSSNRTAHTSASANRSGSSNISHSAKSSRQNNNTSPNNQSRQASAPPLPPPLPNRKSYRTSASEASPKVNSVAAVFVVIFITSILLVFIWLGKSVFFAKENSHSSSDASVKESQETTTYCSNSRYWVKLGGVCYQVELALDSISSQIGLGFRQTMPAEYGMLYFYEYPTMASHATENMLFPIDILFFDNEQRLVNQHHNAPPCHGDYCPLYHSDQPVRYVLELNAGQADRLHLRRGDELVIGPGIFQAIKKFPEK